ncbi:hypothetical protein HZB96_03365 [Candidatus Gottesmanbacteria bacterium]|nr:hypothetical protein [Candidatus Gottesmanbacteria bacterium]
MKKNTGLTGIQILLIILALFVFSLIGLSIPRILVYLASPKEQQTQLEVAKQIEGQIEEKRNEKPCFDTKDLWYWSFGDKKGRADLSFSQDHKGASGNLLDSTGKKTIYSFLINSWDSKTSVGIAGQQAKAYGTGSITCNIVTLTLDKACSQSCEVDEPNSYGKFKIDFSSTGLPQEISIVQ